MVVLGDGADGVSDVRIDDLGKVSLCCGYFWRSGYGVAGVFDWELVDGEEEGGDDGWCGDDEFLNNSQNGAAKVRSPQKAAATKARKSKRAA